MHKMGGCGKELLRSYVPLHWEEEILIRQELWQEYILTILLGSTAHFSGISTLPSGLCCPHSALRLRVKEKTVVEVIYTADQLDSSFSDGREVYKVLLPRASYPASINITMKVVHSGEWGCAFSDTHSFSEEASDVRSAFWFLGQTPNSVPSFQHKFYQCIRRKIWAY